MNPAVRLSRYFHQTRDRNFTGFKKRQKGAYQWKSFIPEKFVLGKPLWDFLASRIRSTDRVLDIGCGDGAYGCTLAARCEEVVGIDADWDGIHLARQKKKEHRVRNVSFIQIPISQIRQKLSARAGQFDVIYSMDVIEHLPYPEELLEAIQAMLAPNGTAFVGTPLFVSPELVSRFHVKEYKAPEIRALISSVLDIESEAALPFRRKDDKVYPEGFYIAATKLKALPLRNENRRGSERVAPNLRSKILACVRERRLPYGLHLFKDGVRSRAKFLWVRLRRRIRPYQVEIALSRAWYRRGLARRRNRVRPKDLVFVFKKQTAGWILEGICREIARYFPGKTETYFMDSRKPWPASKNYFFSHFSFLPECLKYHPRVWGGKVFVFYTHPKEADKLKKAETIYSFNKCDKIICMNSASVRSLESQGVDAKRLTAILGGADPDLFRPHERNGGLVGFSTAFYPRKSPDRMLEIVRSMPHRRFILLGPLASDEGSRHRRWNRYKRFSELLSLKNFTYLEAPYAEYPKHYESVDVFVSVSKLEGGPIPLIETMMCNSVPVVSRTGFAPDIVRHGENGFLFDPDSPTDAVAALIEKAYEIRTDIRRTAEHLSWKNYSRQIQELLN